MNKKNAILLGPFIGELYWEAARFAPLLPYMITKQFQKKDITYIILTRPERFDLYGKYADILVPLRIEGDYINKYPNCFKLNNFSQKQYEKIINKFNNKYKERYNVIKHITPNISRGHFVNKNQYPRKKLIFNYQPRKENYDLVDEFIPNKKPLVVLAPRYRKGFKRNWKNWQDFYDIIFKDKDLMDNFNFIICGKSDEYIPDKHKRFLDINDIVIGKDSSLIGLLLALLEKSSLVCGSQSAIPNIALLYKVDVLEFGCQKALHTKTYNIHNTPIEFIDNRKYDIPPQKLFKKLRINLQSKRI